MRQLSAILISLTLTIIYGCKGRNAVVSNSKEYQPEEMEQSMYNRIDRTVFPSDIRNRPEKFNGKFVNWLGILKQVDIKKKANSDTSIVSIKVDQKYWDYVEDYSIQDERIFLSPKGEGEFTYNFEFLMTPESEKNLKAEVGNKSLGMFYGYAYRDTLNNNTPTLIGAFLKFFDYKEYSTAILSYDIERDKNGYVVSENGRPVTANFQRLKVPGKGQNK
jgi:hypothetical protein